MERVASRRLDQCWLPPSRFDGLTEAIPAEIPICAAAKADSQPPFWHYSAEPKTLIPGAVASLWFTVRVPRDAAPGLYEGTVTVAAEGLPETPVPLQLHVSAWTAPDSQDFRVQNFLYSAEEVIPKYYGVPVWSDRHFELFGKVLALLAEVNSRQVQANLLTDYQGGGSNPESLVRWIKQADGSYKHDFTNFDKYLGMIAKSISKPNTLRLNLWASDRDGGYGDDQSSVTVLDPVTKQLSNTNVVMPVRHADAVFMVPTGKLPPLWALDGPRRNTFTYTPRHQIWDGALLSEPRQLIERLAVGRGFDGLGEFGGNLFPLKSPSGGFYNTAAGRGTKWLSATVLKSLLYPGPDGPVATERFEMFREGLELCEAMLYVQQAVAAKKLSPDLAQRASQYLHPTRDAGLGERVIAVQRGWFSARMMPSLEDAKLLDLAGEVARELEGKK